MIFSPLPYTSYKALESVAPTLLSEPSEWNLYYLSDKRLDETVEVLDSYPSKSQILWACKLTCEIFSEVRDVLLSETAEEAVRYIRTRPDYNQLPIIELLGTSWLENALRVSKHRPSRGVLFKEGNVLSVNFGGHVMSVNKSSAVLMPMSYDKH